MVCRERDVIRLLVNQFRFAGIRCAGERRSVYILGRDGGTVAATVNPCGVGIYMVIELMPESDVQFMSVVELAGIPVGIKSVNFCKLHESVYPASMTL